MPKFQETPSSDSLGPVLSPRTGLPAAATRQGVCPSCAGHGVVRVPVAGGPYMSITERESHDNECEE